MGKEPKWNNGNKVPFPKKNGLDC